MLRKKKNISKNILYYVIFIELQCLDEKFSRFFRVISVCQCLFTLNILLDEVDRELGQEKKHFVGRCLYQSWITYTNDL